MSRSYKKNPIIRDRGLKRQDYWQAVRSNWNQVIKKWYHTDSDEPDFEHRHAIVNQYSRCDWRYIDYEDPKFRRK